jgi:1,4-alpha-glucan branching enzyme
LGRCLTAGFAYQGEVSLYRNGKTRGESTEGLPPTAFVSFLQNHDQVGNRAFGERIIQIADPHAVRAAAAILLLAPPPPLLFMGEEFGAETPFFFFCDFEKNLAAAVTAGRRNEFAHFARFNNPAERDRIPDPSDAGTFKASQLDWSVIAEPGHQDWLRFYRKLLGLRREHIVPRLATGCAVHADYEVHGDRGLTARWKFSDQSELSLMANLGTDSLSGLNPPASQVVVVYASEQMNADALKRGTLPAWSVVWFLK